MLFRWVFLVLLAVASSAPQAQITFRAAAQSGTIAVQYRGAGTAAAAASGNVTPALPAGWQVGDLHICLVSSDDNVDAGMAGWTAIYEVNNTAQLRVSAFYRIAQAGDTNPTVTHTGGDSIIAQVVGFHNVDQATPIEGAVTTSSGSDLTTEAPGTTVNKPGSMLVFLGGVRDDNNTSAGAPVATNANPTASWTSMFYSETTQGSDQTIFGYYGLYNATGTVASLQSTRVGAGNENSIGAQLVVRPQITQVTVSVPAGTLAEDQMIASIAVSPSGATVATPAGWTLLQETAGTGNRLLTYRRTATGAEPGSYTWTLGGTTATGAAGGIASYVGVDASTPVDISGANTTPAGGDPNTTHRATGVTTTTGNTMVVTAHSLASSVAWTPPGGMTERVDAVSLTTASAAGVSLEMNDELQAAAGATGNKSATVGSNGDNGAAHIVVLRPNLVLHLAMDEATWVATAVADSSGSGMNGTAVSGASTAGSDPAIPGATGTCRYGSFNGTTQYVQVAHDARLSMTGSFTVTAWINPSSLGTELKTIVSKDENYEFHLTPAGEINWWWQNSGGTAQQFTTAGAGITTGGGWYHVAVVYASGSQVIYVNGVARGTATFTGGLTTNTDPLQVGADQYPSQPLRVFEGQIDEVRVIRKALTAAEVAQVMNTTRTCAVYLDHYSFSHSTSGIACDDHVITITAHDPSHAATDAGGAALSLSTTNAKGTWTGIVSGGGSLTGVTAGAGTATYTFAPGSSSVALSFRYANLAASSETFGFNASDGTYSETTGAATGSDDPSFTMAQAGFRFRNLTDGNTTVPTQISGKPSDTGWNAKTIRLQAIRTDTATGACTALFASQSRTVDLGAECNSPAICAGLQVAINGGNIATSADNGGAGAASYTGVSLNFDASSEAATVITYPDAGQVSLHARYDLDTGVAGYEMTGSSNAFVVRPFGMAIRGAAAGTPIQHGSAATDPILAAAGDNFTMTLAAYRWASPAQDANADGFPDFALGDVVDITGNGLTPNFAPATVSVNAGSNLPGSATGAISRGIGCASPGTVAAASWSGGAATITDWCYSEAGNVQVAALAVDYLSPGVTINGLSSYDGTGFAGGRVGRFRPKHFVVSAGALTNRAAASCGTPSAFSYMDERLALGFTLTAQNAQNATTQNYTGAYARLDLSSAASFGLGARSGATNLSSRLDTTGTPSGAWSNGAASLSVPTSVRRATPDNPDGPYAAISFGIAPVDPDGVAMKPPFDLDVNNDATMDRTNLGVSGEARYGRLRVLNAIGSEKLALAVPIRTEYWSGTGFVTNTADSCTAIARKHIALGFSPASNLSDTNCETAISTASVAFTAGVGSLTLQAPGAGNNGSVLLTPQLRAPGSGSYCSSVGAAPVVIPASSPADDAPSRDYLLGRWNDAANPDVGTDPADANTRYDDNPSGRAAFGVYGNQPSNYIYFRENH